MASKVSNMIPVLSRIPNLCKEMHKANPGLSFQDVITDNTQWYNSPVIVADGDLLIPHLQNLPHTKWVQTTWAGLDKLLSHIESAERLPLITRFSGKHFGRIMSEYVIAAIVNQERKWPTIMKNQTKQEWVTDGQISEYRTISDLTIGILGIGSIGTFVGKSLHNLGATIWGLGRCVRKEDEIPDFLDRYCVMHDLQILLKNCDYIINVLPSTPETIGLLNGDVLKHCLGKSTGFINVGRGSVIQEKYLLNAINSGWISSAVLDVFESEPLSKESPLWTTPNVVITPHVAAISRAKDIAELFADNYKLYIQGKTLPCTLNLVRGY